MQHGYDNDTSFERERNTLFYIPFRLLKGILQRYDKNLSMNKVHKIRKSIKNMKYTVCKLQYKTIDILAGQLKSID